MPREDSIGRQCSRVIPAVALSSVAHVEPPRQFCRVDGDAAEFLWTGHHWSVELRLNAPFRNDFRRKIEEIVGTAS